MSLELAEKTEAGADRQIYTKSESFRSLLNKEVSNRREEEEGLKNKRAADFLKQCQKEQHAQLHTGESDDIMFSVFLTDCKQSHGRASPQFSSELKSFETAESPR